MLDVASPPHERLRDENPAAQLLLHLGHLLRRPATVRVRGAAASERLGAANRLYHSAADERVLAVARLVGAVVLIVATDLDPLHVQTTHFLIGAYALHAALVAAASVAFPDWPLRRAPLLHAVDLGWAVVATTYTGGAVSNIFPVFTFVLLSSAFHWGFAATLRDAFVILFVVVVEVLVFPADATLSFHLNVGIVRIAYMGIGIGLLFGVFLRRQYALQHQATALADIVSRVSHAPRLQPAVRDALSRLLHLFQARHALLIIEDVETGTLHRWRADARGDDPIVLSQVAVPAGERRCWAFGDPCRGTACELRRPGRDGATASIGATLANRMTAPGPRIVVVPSAIASASSWSVLITVPVTSAGVWTGHLSLLDPGARPAGEARLRFLQNLAQQAGPALVNLYLLGRLRSRAEAVERNRISRELHDGALQSLAGLEMRVDALRQVAARVAPGLEDELDEIRDQLHDDAVDLRALMQRLRSPEVDAHQLPTELGDQIARFGRATGIDARLQWGINGLKLSPHHCREVVRVIQEALFNVRRHSGASQVWVRTEANGHAWAVVVEDNGRGLGFTGRLTHEQLQAERKGPRVILERVSALGGTLDVDSSPAGTRLEITLPLDPTE